MITRRKIMAKKLFSVKSKITALALSVLLLIGTVPIQVSAAQTSSNVVLRNGMNEDADIKFSTAFQTAQQFRFPAVLKMTIQRTYSRSFILKANLRQKMT